MLFALSSVQFSRSVVSDSATPWTAASQASLCITNSQSLLTHVHWVGDAIQPSHPLSSPFSSHLQPFPASESFQMSQLFPSESQSIGVSASASDLTMNIQDRFPLGWTGWISLQSRSQESSPAPQFKSINSLALSFPHSPTLTSIHDHWKNQSFD